MRTTLNDLLEQYGEQTRRLLCADDPDVIREQGPVADEAAHQQEVARRETEIDDQKQQLADLRGEIAAQGGVHGTAAESVRRVHELHRQHEAAKQAAYDYEVDMSIEYDVAEANRLTERAAQLRHELEVETGRSYLLEHQEADARRLERRAERELGL